MTSLKTLFLDYIATKIFPGNAPPQLQYYTFLYRFNSDNYSLRHTEIGKQLSSTIGGDCESGINEYIKQVIKKINLCFRDELAQDHVTENMLGISATKTTQGRKSAKQGSPWQVAYQWLWQFKYPRWQQDYIWDSWKQSAHNNSDWIQFNLHSASASKALKVPQPKTQGQLPIDTPLTLEINLDSPGSYLLLFNRGFDNHGYTTQYLITPSQAFAPNYQLAEKITLMPQKNAICEDIQFDAVGKEEYLAILVDQPLDLPWLTPDPAHPALQWQGQHLAQVWEHLQHTDNWRVFYRDFDVVTPDA